mmetsp:Transcript_46936/g.111730  ORF Transcript_46936/g.111730 Transcript_46936/m.111730 type:complete len:202 (+) Transcript_46936:845-1450(+)
MAPACAAWPTTPPARPLAQADPATTTSTSMAAATTSLRSTARRRRSSTDWAGPRLASLTQTTTTASAGASRRSGRAGWSSAMSASRPSLGWTSLANPQEACPPTRIQLHAPQEETAHAPGHETHRMQARIQHGSRPSLRARGTIPIGTSSPTTARHPASCRCRTMWCASTTAAPRTSSSTSSPATALAASPTCSPSSAWSP